VVRISSRQDCDSTLPFSDFRRECRRPVHGDSVEGAHEPDTLVYATHDGDIRIWDIERLAIVRSLNFGYPVHSIAIAPEGDFVMIGYGNQFGNTDNEANQGKLTIVRFKQK
jgi:hypothetical protein